MKTLWFHGRVRRTASSKYSKNPSFVTSEVKMNIAGLINTFFILWIVAACRWSWSNHRSPRTRRPEWCYTRVSARKSEWGWGQFHLPTQWQPLAGIQSGNGNRHDKSRHWRLEEKKGNLSWFCVFMRQDLNFFRPLASSHVTFFVRSELKSKIYFW